MAPRTLKHEQLRSPVACVAAFLLLSAVATDTCGQDIEILPERRVPVTAVFRIDHLSEGEAGELRLCGSGGGGAWVSVVSPKGEEKLSTVVDVLKDGQTERCRSVLSHDSTGTVIAGHTNTHTLVKGDWGQHGKPPGLPRYSGTPSAGLLAWLAPDGSTRRKKISGELKPHAQNAFYRGIRVSDGYVLVGAIAKEWPAYTPRRIAVPAAVRVVKTDFEGDVVWAHDIAEDGEDILNVNNQVYLSALLKLPDGSFVFGMSVQRLEHRIESGERRLYGLNRMKRDGRGGILMVRMSPTGVELKRTWSRAGRHLALRQGEIVAVSNPPREDPTAIVNDRLQVTTFDWDLKSTGSKVIGVSPDFFSIHDFTSSRGRLFAIGNYVEGVKMNLGRPAFVEITENAVRVVARYEEGEWGPLIATRDGNELVTVRLVTGAWKSNGAQRSLHFVRIRVGG